jgi:hypothetical protein
MDAWYYLHEGRQVGPIPFSELVKLAENGVIQSWTQVWSPGMESWKPAGEVEGVVPTPLGPPAEVQPSGLGGGEGANAAPLPTVPPRQYATRSRFESLEPVNTHLMKSILATLLCCLPLGIVAIIKSAQARTKVEDGQLEEARRLAREADNWGNWSIILGLAGSVIYFAIMFMTGALTS